MITENEESKSEVNEKIDNHAKYVDLNEIHQINPITNNKNEISVSNLIREMKSLSDVISTIILNFRNKFI